MDKYIEFKNMLFVPFDTVHDAEYVNEVMEENCDNTLPVRFTNCEFTGMDYDYNGNGGLDWYSYFDKKFKDRTLIFNDCNLRNVEFNEYSTKNIKIENHSYVRHCYFQNAVLDGKNSSFEDSYFLGCDFSKVKLSEFMSCQLDYVKDNLNANKNIDYQSNLFLSLDLNQSTEIDGKKFRDLRNGKSIVTGNYSLPILSETNQFYLFGQEELPKFMEANAVIFRDCIKNSIQNYKGRADGFEASAKKDLMTNVKGLDKCGYIRYFQERNSSLYNREIGDLPLEIVNTMVRELKNDKVIKKDENGLYKIISKTKSMNKTHTDNNLQR